MAATEETDGGLSLAQVEEELRSAEAYLTACEVPPRPPVDTPYKFSKGDMGASTEREWPPRNDSGLEREDSNFRRKLRTRPVLSEERRREILSKLSSERQAALGARHVGVDTVAMDGVGELPPQHWSMTASGERAYRTPEERHQLIEKLLSDRSRNFSSEAAAVHDLHLGGAPVRPVDVERGEELNGEFQHEAGTHSDIPSAESDDEDEIYYASDILDKVDAVDIQPRSKLDLIFEGGGTQQMPDRDGGSPKTLPTQVEFLALMPNSNDKAHEPVSPSLFAQLLGQNKEAETLANDAVIQSPFKEDYHYADAPWEPANAGQEENVVYAQDVTNIDQRNTATKRPSNRIDFLAQPRNQTFAEREKQRILLEMEQLRECTFHPNVLKQARSISKPGAVGLEKSAGRPGTIDFQWLTLSPRQKIFRRADDSKDGYTENAGQNVIQRLHLDGTTRYDSRERAREALEAQKLEECTFRPKINPTSKSMFCMVDYKPIHHRVSDLQRAKVEYIERIREQLDLEECGPLSFTPMINPKSREIATNKLAEREAEAFSQYSVGKPKSNKVTDRLAEDAEVTAERRLATQEYFDLVNEQSFAPKISETSRKIVEQKPEFKMDFVARQEYFHSRDQEKMEALEGFCEIDNARGERHTFKPDIGNAEGVLKQLRPDRCTKSSQQKLYRLTYNDQREAELKKQRLREEQYSQYTFKPEINPVSKALGRSSTLDELSHPVLDIQHDLSVSKCSPPQERSSVRDSPASRVALRQYFANKRFRSRVALEMEEASKAECTFTPTLVTSKNRNGSASTSKLYNRGPRSRTKLEWQSENLLHLIEAERHKKADEIEAKRNAQELKELEECTFRPNLQKPRRRGKASAKGSPSPPRDSDAEEKPVIVRGLGRFLELRDLARKQQAEQKQREKKVFAPNTAYEPRSYTVPKPFKLSESSRDSIKRRLKVREEMRTKERQECTFRPHTVSSQNRRVLQNMLNN
ncbi:hypothetical protein PHYPSEUDO_009383 [Phytophthora pseudosyringae]|uniref:Uncharacterized protein n=1 Tax=Phytophthora pseudosyringae TaxID=221518 RepID=A0A8T1WE37_9STRA|nr:hypothetical protein PHYPSEUDO_009383 [Phytophthora pseudosyringae]